MQWLIRALTERCSLNEIIHNHFAGDCILPLHYILCWLNLEANAKCSNFFMLSEQNLDLLDYDAVEECVVECCGVEWSVVVVTTVSARFSWAETSVQCRRSSVRRHQRPGRAVSGDYPAIVTHLTRDITVMLRYQWIILVSPCTVKPDLVECESKFQNLKVKKNDWCINISAFDTLLLSKLIPKLVSSGINWKL